MYNEQGDYTVQVCFSPLSWPLFDMGNAIVIVADIFRASTAICTAIHYGVAAIIPVETIEESEQWKARGYISAGERDGKTLACADFGNSPFNFMAEHLRGKTIVMNTTNGTRAINMAARNNPRVLVGSFINLSAVCAYARQHKKNINILCAGWKDRFSMEDALFAGAATEEIIKTGKGAYHTVCDSAIASVDLWQMAKHDPALYIEKAAHRHRLKRLGIDDVIAYSLTLNQVASVPVWNDDRLVDYKTL